jgi:hypothetical protein
MSGFACSGTELFLRTGLRDLMNSNCEFGLIQEGNYVSPNEDVVQHCLRFR